MTSSNRILIVVTSSARMGSAPEPTGYWLEEVAAPYYRFVDKGFEVDIASPKGGNAPRDFRSDAPEMQTEDTKRFCKDATAKLKIELTLPLSEIRQENYQAVFFAGGHGTMDDFASDASVAEAVEAFQRAGKPVSAVCHGPACLVQAKAADGQPLIKGKRLCCFTDMEETMIGLEKMVPFLLESKLRELGAIINAGPDFEPHVIIDGRLVTGQNPASSRPVADAVLALLQEAAAA